MLESENEKMTILPIKTVLSNIIIKLNSELKIELENEAQYTKRNQIKN